MNGSKAICRILKALEYLAENSLMRMRADAATGIASTAL